MNQLSNFLARICFGLCICVLSTVNAQEPKPTITVRGYAQTTLPADSAVVMATIEGRAKEADKAFEAVEKKTQLLSTAIKSAGFADEAMRVQPISIMRYYTQRATGKGKSIQSSMQQAESNNQLEEVAFQASRQLYVAVADLKKLNAAQTALLQSGVERLDRVEFKSSKSTDEYARLRLAAVKEARTKAAAMAGELGAVLASIKSMTDQSSPFPANRTTASRRYDNDPFGSSGMGGSMGGYGSDEPATNTTLITLVAEVDIVFNLGKAELSN